MIHLTVRKIEFFNVLKLNKLKTNEEAIEIIIKSLEEKIKIEIIRPISIRLKNNIRSKFYCIHSQYKKYMVKSGDRYTKLKKEFNESFFNLEFTQDDFKCCCFTRNSIENLHESNVLIGEINQINQRFEKLKVDCINEIESFFSDRQSEVDKTQLSKIICNTFKENELVKSFSNMKI